MPKHGAAKQQLHTFATPSNFETFHPIGFLKATSKYGLMFVPLLLAQLPCSIFACSSFLLVCQQDH